MIRSNNQTKNKEEERPTYYAIIPANVRYDKTLKDKAKLLYGEITCLSNKHGICYASNKYFADLYGVSVTTISTLIKNLIDNGYLEREIIYKEGSKEILNRYLKIVKEPYLKNFKYPTQENLKENNTSINKTSNNNKERKKEGNSYNQIIDEMVSDEEVKKEIFEFIKMRKFIKKPMSDRALKMLIKKLNEMSSNKEEQIEILEKSIINSWSDIYPIKKDYNKKSEGNKAKNIEEDEWLKGLGV